MNFIYRLAPLPMTSSRSDYWSVEGFGHPEEDPIPRRDCWPRVLREWIGNESMNRSLAELGGPEREG